MLFLMPIQQALEAVVIRTTRLKLDILFVCELTELLMLCSLL